MASYGLYIPYEHQIAVYMQKNRSRTFKTIKHEGFAEQMETLERDQTGLSFERHWENLQVVAHARENGHLKDIDQFLKLSSNKWKHSDISGQGSLLSKPTSRNLGCG